MLPVSGSFLPALVRPHRITSYATGGITPLPVESFSVSVDSNSDCRRVLDCTVAGLDYLPADPSALLAPNGQRISAYRGVVYPDGGSEVCPLGVFRISSWSGNPYTGSISVRAESLECLLADDRFESPRTISGPSVQTVIRELCAETDPGVEFTVTCSMDAVCPAFVAEEDRLATIRQLAVSIGADFRADAFGRWELRDVPTIDRDPVWTVDAATVVDGHRAFTVGYANDFPYGTPYLDYAGRGSVTTRTVEPGALIGADAGESRDGVYNAVTARGENLSDDYPPVTATVVDSDPMSPTYWGGTWGKKRRFYSSPLLTTTAQAESAARAILGKALGAAKTLALETLCNPALEDGDVIYHEGQLYIADAFTIGSGPGDGMRIATRSTKAPE